jgi:hypothetical protein
MSVLSDFKGNVNLSSDTGTSTTIGTTLKVNTVEGKAVGDTLAIGNNLTTGTITIGTALNGSTTSNGLLTIGSTTATSVTTTAKQIKQVVPLTSGSVEVVYGNASNVTSLSTTFNRKRTEAGAGGALNALDCYTISTPNQTFTSQYFEIIISGSNLFYGGYSYKGGFSLYNPGISPGAGVSTPSSVTTLFSANGIPTVTLTVSGQTTTLSVRTNLGGSTNQNFMTTLIGYPTIGDNNALFDFAITAI